MKIKWNAMALMAIAGFSDVTMSQAVTGKIMIDGQEYSSGSSNVIRGSGKIVTDKRKLQAFNRLSVDIAADVEYIAADGFAIELIADDNIALAISTTISGDSLTIDSNRSFSSQSKLRARIFGTPALQGITINAASDVNLRGINSNKLEINLDGTGDLVAQGQVQKLTIKVDGSSDVNTKKLDAKNVMVSVDGAGDVLVTAKNQLDVVIDGAGDVTYFGHPNTVNKSIDGAGDISAGD